MGSISPLKLATIDFSELGLESVSTPEWDSIRSQVQQALGEYGCFEALFPKVHKDILEATISALEELFDLPLHTKMKNSSRIPFHGYVGQYPQAPLYESMGIPEADDLGKAKSFAEIFWPEGNLTFCDTMQSFTAQLSELDLIVRRMILESIGVEKYYEEHKDSTNYLLRVMKYKGPETNDAKIGLHAHTDKNIVTVLFQNQVEGLEVQTKGGEWIKFKPSASGDSFVVMTGESLDAWTNGRFRSSKHRVMMTGNEARYSLGLFSVPKAGYIIKAPAELVDDEHPLLFKPYDHVEFLKFYYTEAGQRAKSALKTFCGVKIDI